MTAILGYVLLAPLALCADPPTDGLLLWLDAAAPETLQVKDGRVLGWHTRVPGGDAALRPGTRQAPRFVPATDTHRAVVAFDGMNDCLRTLDFGQTAERWTLIMVVAPCKGGGGLCSGSPPAGHDFDPGFTVDTYMSGPRFDQISVEGAGRIGGQQDQLTRDFPCGELHVIAVERDDTEIRLWVDGEAEGKRPATPARTDMSELRVGARYYGGYERAFLDGAVAEVLLYGRILPGDALAALQRARLASPAERAAGRDRLKHTREERRMNRMAPPKLIQTWPDTEAYEAWKRDQAGEGFVPLAQLPIRDDLHEAMALCAHHLNSLYDADRDDEPFFYSNLRADGTGEMHHSIEIGIPHVVGRCLLGCMMAELKAGIPFPEDGLAILERYLKSSFDNPDHLNSYYDPRKDGARLIEFHNMREGLWGLWALVAGRDSAWAREKADRMLETLERLTDEQGRWSMERAKALGMEERCLGMNVPNAARMVDPLMAYHRETGNALALNLAGLYAREGMAIIFEEDGAFAPMDRSSGHVHSVTSSLSSIADYARFVGDRDLLSRCWQIVQVGVPRYHSSWGWGDEVYPDHPADVPGRGEINQTGDVIRTALILGDAGFPGCYDLAERYSRSMLLPTQHREADLRRFVRDVEDPDRDAVRNVVDRTVGGYAMQLPNDRMREGDWPLSTLDITSGAVHALAECWAHRVTVKDRTCYVNLLFDADHEAVRVDSGLPLEGRVTCTMKTALDLAIRIPEYVDPRKVDLEVDGRIVTYNDPPYVRIGHLDVGSVATIRFDIPCRQESERVDGADYTTEWVGNQIVSIAPRGAVSPLPF